MADRKIAPSRLEWELLCEVAAALEVGETTWALADALDRPEPSVGRTLRRMEADGLLTSRTENGWGRVWTVTPGGLRVRAALRDGLRAYREVTDG